MRGEVGRERAFFSTSSSQELTCSTRCDCVQGCVVHHHHPLRKTKGTIMSSSAHGSHLIITRWITFPPDLLSYLIQCYDVPRKQQEIKISQEKKKIIYIQRFEQYKIKKKEEEKLYLFPTIFNNPFEKNRYLSLDIYSAIVLWMRLGSKERRGGERRKFENGGRQCL